MEQAQDPAAQFENILIKLDEEEHPQTLLTALQFLEKIFNNIAQNPTEQKFRNVKTTNKTLKEKVFNVDGIEKLLQCTGYTFDGELYTLPDTGIISVISVISILRDFVSLQDAKLNKSEQEVEKLQQIMKAKKEQNKVQQQKNAEMMKVQQQLEYDQKNRQTWEKGISSKKVDGPGFGKGVKTTASENGCSGAKGG